MKKVKWLKFSDAKKYTTGLKLKNRREWNKRSKSSMNRHDVPSNPDRVYKEWRGWGDFLGNNNKPHSRPRKYNINDNFFKKWSHNMSYILGFWFTDGHICKNNFCITQHEDNRYLLKKILDAMGSDYPIYKSSESVCRISIRSKEIVNDIKKIGGAERKSTIIKFPKIPKKYLSDFIRGLWDGDGCIFYGKKDGCFESHYVTASKSFAESLLSILKKLIPGIRCKMSFRKTKNNTMVYNINLYKNSTVLLGDLMYGRKDEMKIVKKYDCFMLANKSN